MPGRKSSFTSQRAPGARQRRTSAETAAAFLAGRRAPPEVSARGVVTVLQQIRVGDEYRYRDEATGRVLTVVEARQIRGPSRVKYLQERR